MLSSRIIVCVKNVYNECTDTLTTCVSLFTGSDGIAMTHTSTNVQLPFRALSNPSFVAAFSTGILRLRSLFEYKFYPLSTVPITSTTNVNLFKRR